MKARLKARLDPVDDLVVLKDGFGWGAFFLGPLWFANQRAWAVGFVDLVSSGVFFNLAIYSDDPTGFYPALGFAGFVATRLFFGFEGFDAIRDHRRAEGFALVARVNGGDDEEALLIYINQMPLMTKTETLATKANTADSTLFPAGALAKAFGARSRFGKGSVKS